MNQTLQQNSCKMNESEFSKSLLKHMIYDVAKNGKND